MHKEQNYGRVFVLRDAVAVRRSLCSQPQQVGQRQSAESQKAGLQAVSPVHHSPHSQRIAKQIEHVGPLENKAAVRDEKIIGKVDRFQQCSCSSSSKLGGLFQQALHHGTVLVNGDEVKPPQVALAPAVTEHQLKKIFTFHRNAASARSFASEERAGIGTLGPDVTAWPVNVAMSTAARDGLMTEFKAARQALERTSSVKRESGSPLPGINTNGGEPENEKGPPRIPAIRDGPGP